MTNHPALFTKGSCWRFTRAVGLTLPRTESGFFYNVQRAPEGAEFRIASHYENGLGVRVLCVRGKHFNTHMTSTLERRWRTSTIVSGSIPFDLTYRNVEMIERGQPEVLYLRVRGSERVWTGNRDRKGRNVGEAYFFSGPLTLLTTLAIENLRNSIQWWDRFEAVRYNPESDTHTLFDVPVWLKPMCEHIRRKSGRVTHARIVIARVLRSALHEANPALVWGGVNYWPHHSGPEGVILDENFRLMDIDEAIRVKMASKSNIEVHQFA